MAGSSVAGVFFCLFSTNGAVRARKTKHFLLELVTENPAGQ